MRVRKREIARSGIYGAADNPKYVTAKDIKEIAETFSDIGRAPIQFGHETAASSPRMGNVVAVYSDGNSLYADIEEHDALADAVDSGFYPDVSIGAKQRAKDGKMYLHHLAYLGQEPPAVKKLIAEIKEPLGIVADDAGVQVLFPPLGEFRMNLSESVNKPTAGPYDAAMAVMLTKPKKEENEVTEDEAKKLQEENKRLKNELEKRNIELSDSMKHKAAANNERLKSAFNAAKIPTPQRELFLQIAAAIEPGKVIELSNGWGGTGELSAIDALISLVSSIKPPVQEGALNLNDLDGQTQSKRDYSRLKNKG